QYTFSWTKNGAVIPGATGPSISVTQAGDYGVTYTDIIDTCQPVTDVIKIEYYPQIATPNPIHLYKCDTVASSYVYDLSLNTPILMAGMTPGTQISYFDSEANANSNTGALALNHTAAPGETIYVRIKKPTDTCFVVKNFKLLTTPAPIAHQLPDMNKCARSATLNDAMITFGSLMYPALNGQSAVIYKVKFYASLANANNDTNAITNANYL